MTPKPEKTKAKPAPKPRVKAAVVTHPLIEKHADLLFDLCHSLLAQPEESHRIFAQIVQRLVKESREHPYRRFEKAWILKTALDIFRVHPDLLTDKSRLYDWSLEAKLENMPLYLKRLPLEDQFLLLTHLKHGISLSELAAVFNKPEASLTLQKNFAIQALEEWIFRERSGNIEPILKTISNQHARAAQHPINIRQIHADPLATHRPGLREKWKRLPWWVRNLSEALSIGLVIFLILHSVPQARVLYEKAIQKRLESFDLEELAQESQSGIPFDVPIPGSQPAIESNGTTADTAPELEAEEEATNEAAAESEPVVKVGSAEIWRFSIRAENVKEVKPKVIRLLEIAGAAKGSDLKGLDAPGGVQFNLLVEQARVLELMKTLKALAIQTAEQSNTPKENAFTWFKNSSRKPIPAGQTRVIIWMSQL